MPSSFAAVANGDAGIPQIVAELGRLKTIYGRLPAIRSAALCIFGGVGNHDQAAQVCELARFVRRSLVYVADPINAEFIVTPDVLLLQISARGLAYGDCDDHCLLFASLCESIGIPCEIVGVQADAGGRFDHVVCDAYLDAGLLTFDLVAKGAEQPAYTARILPP